MYCPSGVTSPVLFNKFSLGILTLLNVKNPLSTPFNPILGPMSPTTIPGNEYNVFGSLL